MAELPAEDLAESSTSRELEQIGARIPDRDLLHPGEAQDRLSVFRKEGEWDHVPNGSLTFESSEGAEVVLEVVRGRWRASLLPRGELRNGHFQQDQERASIAFLPSLTDERPLHLLAAQGAGSWIVACDSAGYRLSSALLVQVSGWSFADWLAKTVHPGPLRFADVIRSGASPFWLPASEFTPGLWAGGEGHSWEKVYPELGGLHIVELSKAGNLVIRVAGGLVPRETSIEIVHAASDEHAVAAFKLEGRPSYELPGLLKGDYRVRATWLGQTISEDVVYVPPEGSVAAILDVGSTNKDWSAAELNGLLVGQLEDLRDGSVPWHKVRVKIHRSDTTGATFGSPIRVLSLETDPRSEDALLGMKWRTKLPCGDYLLTVDPFGFSTPLALQDQSSFDVVLNLPRLAQTRVFLSDPGAEARPLQMVNAKISQGAESTRVRAFAKERDGVPEPYRIFSVPGELTLEAIDIDGQLYCVRQEVFPGANSVAIPAQEVWTVSVRLPGNKGNIARLPIEWWSEVEAFHNGTKVLGVSSFPIERSIRGEWIGPSSGTWRFSSLGTVRLRFPDWKESSYADTVVELTAQAKRIEVVAEVD